MHTIRIGAGALTWRGASRRGMRRGGARCAMARSEGGAAREESTDASPRAEARCSTSSCVNAGKRGRSQEL